MRLRFALLSLSLPCSLCAQELPSLKQPDRSALDSITPASGLPTTPDAPRAPIAHQQPLGQRLAFGGHYDASFSDDARLIGVHLAQLADRNANQVGWGFSVHFGVTPGFFGRDSADHSGETAPQDVIATGEKRLQSLALAGGLNICLRSPLWLEATGGYYLPERAARYQTKNGHLKWYAAGDNSALPIGMIALVADFSRYRIPLYARLGAARSDGTTFYSLGLGFAPSLPR